MGEAQIVESEYTGNQTRWRLGCMLVAVVLLIMSLTLVGYMIQSATVFAKSQREYPPPGEMIRVGEHQLHLNCRGAGRPVVIVEAGSGSWSLQWQVVQVVVAEVTEICTYDRAGYGWSEPGPEPRTGKQIVTELHTLLENAGLEGPYILVGHSLGGLFVRLYASEYPDEVVGMVLLDAVHEEAEERMPSEVVQVEEAKLELYGPATLAARLGLLDRAVPAVTREPSGLPSRLQTIYEAYAYRATLFQAIQSEGKAFEQTVEQVKAAGTLGDLPLVVIRHGKPTMFSYLPAEEEQQSEEAWIALQRDLTTLSSNSKLIVATESGHDIHLDQPALVVDVIRALVAQVRASNHMMAESDARS